jgi:hypothetical protein
MAVPQEMAISLSAPEVVVSKQEPHEIRLVSVRKMAVIVKRTGGDPPKRAFIFLTSALVPSRRSAKFWSPLDSEILLPREPLVLSICVPGARWLERTLTVKELAFEERIIFELDPGVLIRGRLLGPDGNRVGGAHVEAVAISINGWPTTPGTLSAFVARSSCDAHGDFELGPLTPGSYRILADVGGVRRKIGQIQATKDSEDLGDLMIRQ